MLDRAAARRGSAAVMVATCLLAAGCGAEPTPLEPNAARGHYEKVAADVIAALDTVAPLGWEPAGALTLPAADPSSCTYSPGTWEATEGLSTGTGQDLDWDQWRDALDPVLREHGFGALGGQEREGGWLYIAATDEHGAELKLIDQGNAADHRRGDQRAGLLRDDRPARHGSRW